MACRTFRRCASQNSRGSASRHSMAGFSLPISLPTYAIGPTMTRCRRTPRLGELTISAASSRPSLHASAWYAYHEGHKKRPHDIWPWGRRVTSRRPAFQPGYGSPCGPGHLIQQGILPRSFRQVFRAPSCRVWYGVATGDLHSPRPSSARTVVGFGRSARIRCEKSGAASAASATALILERLRSSANGRSVSSRPSS